jgi:hypothetical protein
MIQNIINQIVEIIKKSNHNQIKQILWVPSTTCTKQDSFIIIYDDKLKETSKG